MNELKSGVPKSLVNRSVGLHMVEYAVRMCERLLLEHDMVRKGLNSIVPLYSLVLPLLTEVEADDEDDPANKVFQSLNSARSENGSSVNINSAAGGAANFSVYGPTSSGYDRFGAGKGRLDPNRWAGGVDTQVRSWSRALLPLLARSLSGRKER